MSSYMIAAICLGLASAFFFTGTGYAVKCNNFGGAIVFFSLGCLLFVSNMFFAIPFAIPTGQGIPLSIEPAPGLYDIVSGIATKAIPDTDTVYTYMLLRETEKDDADSIRFLKIARTKIDVIRTDLKAAKTLEVIGKKIKRIPQRYVID